MVFRLFSFSCMNCLNLAAYEVQEDKPYRWLHCLSVIIKLHAWWLSLFSLSLLDFHFVLLLIYYSLHSVPVV